MGRAAFDVVPEGGGLAWLLSDTGMVASAQLDRRIG